jgi:hypothetical protein
MRGFLVVAALLAAFSVIVAVVSPFTSVLAADVCPANPNPPDASDPSIIVDMPQSGETITSPVTISGTARVFEANVRIKIYNASGSELADTFTTAAEGAPAMAPFSASVSFKATMKEQGCIRVFEESAKDGSPVNVVQREVMLAPPTTPPQTGSAGLHHEDSDKHIALYAAGSLAIVGAVALALHRRLWT